MNLTLKLWLFRLLFFTLGILLIALPILPLNFSPSRITMPDMLLCLSLAWIVRRPDSAPLVLVAMLALLADAVLSRPIGLWAGMMIIATEIVRNTASTIRERGLIFEIAMVGILLISMYIVQNLLLFITFLDVYPLGILAQLFMITLICYPITVAILYNILRVRATDSRLAPDRLGKIT